MCLGGSDVICEAVDDMVRSEMRGDEEREGLFS